MNTKAWVYIGLGVLIVVGIGVYKRARGIRNNNPGNIRLTGDKWVGLARRQTDGEFFQFSEAKWGIRAMAKILRNYQTRYGLNTVRSIIGRWAPPVENDTEAYITSVARNTGFDPDQALNLRDTETLATLIKAIIRHENGINPYSDATILEGIARA